MVARPDANSRVREFRSFSLVVLSVICLSAVPAGAAVLYSTGFEIPNLTTGTLAGQDLWIDGGNAAHLTVESFFTQTGTQAVQISGNGSFGPIGAFQTLNYSPTVDTEVDVSVGVYHQGGTSGLGFQLTGTNQNGASLGYATMNGSFLQVTSGNGTQTVNGVSLSANTWYTMSMAYNFANQTFNVLLNGNSVVQNLPFLALGSTQFQGAGFYLKNPGSDNFYVDNFSVVTSTNNVNIVIPTAVPEPATLAPAGLLVLAVAVWRRRQTA